MKTKPTEQNRNSSEQPARRKGLFRGEWILIIAVCIISGITGFLFTRSELRSSEAQNQVVRTDSNQQQEGTTSE